LPILVGETDLVDLVLIEGIRIFYPELYAAIRNNPDAFSPGVTDPLGFKREPDQRALSEGILKSALQNYSEADRKAGSIVVQAIFPRTGAADLFRAGAYSADINEGRTADKRIAAKEYFSRYFNYGVPSDDISDQDVETFLDRIPGEAIEDLVEDFKKLSSNNRVHLLIEKLRNKEESLKPETAAILALVVALSGGTFPYTHPTDRFFGLGTISQASALIRHLLHRIEDQSARESLAIELARRVETLPFAYDYSNWMREMKKSHYSDEMVSVVSEQTEHRIKEIVVERIAAFAKEEPIERRYPQDAQQMYRLWSFVDKQSLRDYLERRIEASPSDAAEFVSAANGIDPSSETSRDWGEDLGWFDFICDLIPPDQILRALHLSHPQTVSAEYNFVESTPMNNKERAARWFQWLYREKKPKLHSDSHPENSIEKNSLGTAEPSLTIFLEPQLINKSDERDEHGISVFVENTRETTVDDYRVEVEFPSEFLQKGWHPSWEQFERETKTHRFFRMTREFFEGGVPKWTLYGKDRRRVFTINFYVDKDNYRAEFLNQKIQAKVYKNDLLADHMEIPMRDVIPDR
jgi:hypothetical protein